MPFILVLQVLFALILMFEIILVKKMLKSLMLENYLCGSVTETAIFIVFEP